MRLSLFLALILVFVHTTIALPVGQSPAGNLPVPQVPSWWQRLAPQSYAGRWLPGRWRKDWPPRLKDDIVAGGVETLPYRLEDTPRPEFVKGHLWTEGNLIQARPVELSPLPGSSAQVRDQIDENLLNTPCWMVVTRDAKKAKNEKEKTYHVALLSPSVKQPNVFIGYGTAPGFIANSQDHVNPLFQGAFSDNLKMSANEFSLKTTLALSFRERRLRHYILSSQEYRAIRNKMAEILALPPVSSLSSQTPPTAGPSRPQV